MSSETLLHVKMGGILPSNIKNKQTKPLLLEEQEDVQFTEQNLFSWLGEF